ncbi:MAG: co-chaperone GroES [Thermotoga sp.]|nr:co-chaperone GroES [Thermotogota bacterium]RKX56330.1 MAG: co-chaperone GroES [Thermotoga sp.]
MKVTPLGERVFIKPIKEEKKSEGGLVLPDTAKDKPQRAKVIAVGDSDEIKVKVGDTVIFAKYAGTELKLDEEDYIIIDNGDLLAVVEE